MLGVSAIFFYINQGFTFTENGIFISDNAHGRILETEFTDSPTMTVETCVQACNAQNFTVAGLEFSSTFFSYLWEFNLIDINTLSSML